MPTPTRVERPIRDEYRGAYRETFAILAAHYPNGAPHALVRDVVQRLRADLRAAIENARQEIGVSARIDSYTVDATNARACYDVLGRDE